MDHNEYSCLEHVPGWMGGHFELNGRRVSINNDLLNMLELPVVRLFDKLVCMEAYSQAHLYANNIIGEDDDHGHVYPWTATRIHTRTEVEGIKCLSIEPITALFIQEKWSLELIESGVLSYQ